MMNKPYNFAYVYNDAVQIEVLMHMIYNLHQYFFNLQKKKRIFFIRMKEDVGTSKLKW